MSPKENVLYSVCTMFPCPVGHLPNTSVNALRLTLFDDCESWLPLKVAAEKMEAARSGQKAITGTGADLRKLGMHEARLRLLEMNLGLDEDAISSEPRFASMPHLIFGT